MTNINNSTGLGAPAFSANYLKRVAENPDETFPSLSVKASGQFASPLALVAQRGLTSDASMHSGARSKGDGRGRTKRSVEQPDTLASRAVADAWVAKAFARASADYVFQTPVIPPDVPVPTASTLGRWRTQLDDAFKDPMFLEWAEEQGLDTKELELKPSTGELTGYVGGKKHTFSLSDESGWSDVSRGLLSAAKIIVPESSGVIVYPWPEGKVPMAEVGGFYDQPLFLTLAQAHLQLRKLKEFESFSFVPSRYASQRSPEALEEQQIILGDAANDHALITALKLQANDPTGRVNLNKVMIPIDHRSTYFRMIDEMPDEVSVADVLEAYDLHVPANARQAHNLAAALSIDLAHRAPQVDKGGVLPLTRRSEPGTLNAEALKRLGQIVDSWKAQPTTIMANASGVQGADSLLARLIRFLPESTRNTIKDNPAAALDAVIRSPEAKAWGTQVQLKLGGVETSTSAIEYVSAALALDLDPDAGGKRHNLMGYNPYNHENIGASPAEIVERFIRYLESRVGVEAAPVAARLLLSISAPEFLAKDLPADLIYGSHTWVTYSIEALRIEKKVPGAVANMTFSQIMLFGQTEPISEACIDELNEVRRRPVIDWGLANQVITQRTTEEYTADDYNLCVKAILQQQKELGWAKQVMSRSPRTRKDIALEELKRVFGEGINFEKEVLSDARIEWPHASSYSLLDLYMSNHLSWGEWVSSDEAAVPFSKVRRELGKLHADISSVFDEQFSKHQASREAAFNTLFRYHVSLMPAVERDILGRSDISLYAVRKTYDGDNYVKIGDKEVYKPGVKPSPEEVEQLTGRHGLLIQADRGNGTFDFYSYFPASGKIIKEPGLTRALVSRPQKPWVGSTNFPLNDLGDVLKIDDNPYHGKPPSKNKSTSRILVERLAPPNTDRSSALQPFDSKQPFNGNYFSKRTRALGATASLHFTHGAASVRAHARGSTKVEKERQTNKATSEFFLSLVPFYDGIVSAINGDVAGAAFDLGFDALGFFLPSFGAGKKALKGGRGWLRAVGSGLAKGTAASFSLDDLFASPKNIKNGLNALSKNLDDVISLGGKRTARAGNVFDPKKKYVHGDVVRDFYQKRVGDVDAMTPVSAIFLRGGWYAYNVLTKTPSGIQMAQYGVVHAVI